MDHLRRFYEIAAEAGLAMPVAIEDMREAIALQKAELWPIGAPTGQMVGGALFMLDTVHIAVLPAWHGRWITRTMRRAYDTWTHDIPIRAVISPDNSKVIALATRLGFKFRSEDGLYHTYVKEPTHGTPA